MVNYLTIPGAQLTKNERNTIKNIASNFDKPVMVNIGIMWGASMWCLREGAPNGKLYGVDLYPKKWKIHDVELLNATIIKGDSRIICNDFDVEIDVLLIDGDHHYNIVHDDIKNWVPKCTGFVMFHDYSPTEHNLRQFPELEGVKRAVDEWFGNNSTWESLELVDSLKVFKNANNR